MKVTAHLNSGISYTATGDSGFDLTMDGNPEYGGTNAGPRPMEVVLMGLAGCTGIDVRMILDKMQQKISDIDIQIEAERADAVPAVFTKIHVHYIVTGTDLSEERVGRAVDLSSEKYCSVSTMLKGSVEMSHSFEVRPA